MTTIKSVTKAVRAKPGPKPKPADQLVMKKTVSLKPATYEGLVELGEGVLSKGIEAMYESSTKRRKRTA
jgi:hypothetical protein